MSEKQTYAILYKSGTPTLPEALARIEALEADLADAEQTIDTFGRISPQQYQKELAVKAARIAALEAALRQCAAAFATSPGSVGQCQSEISAEFQRRLNIAAAAIVTDDGKMTTTLPLHALRAAGTPELLSREEKLVWILGDLMNAVENYFGAENPKRLGHINSAAIRIIDEVLKTPALSQDGAGDASDRQRTRGK